MAQKYNRISTCYTIHKMYGEKILDSIAMPPNEGHGTKNHRRSKPPVGKASFFVAAQLVLQRVYFNILLDLILVYGHSNQCRQVVVG